MRSGWSLSIPFSAIEANKRRPAVVVSNDSANAVATRLGRGVVTVVPVTGNVSRVRPFQVLLEADLVGLRLDSKAQAEQVRSVSVERLGRSIGRLAGRHGAARRCPAAASGAVTSSARHDVQRSRRRSVSVGPALPDLGAAELDPRLVDRAPGLRHLLLQHPEPLHPRFFLVGRQDDRLLGVVRRLAGVLERLPLGLLGRSLRLCLCSASSSAASRRCSSRSSAESRFLAAGFAAGSAPDGRLGRSAGWSAVPARAATSESARGWAPRSGPGPRRTRSPPSARV